MKNFRTCVCGLHFLSHTNPTLNPKHRYCKKYVRLVCAGCKEPLDGWWVRSVYDRTKRKTRRYYHTTECPELPEFDSAMTEEERICVKCGIDESVYYKERTEKLKAKVILLSRAVKYADVLLAGMRTCGPDSKGLCKTHDRGVSKWFAEFRDLADETTEK